ncbi:DNA-directed RNA polymerase specialized sigma24 family protein [Nonomuraea muscovyensis]|uniref:DNA-directed RNA polymerase specialized sigma24 family protein n=1 Tax=Nonomuraea muscovyensis TaxID=1124761 RepID=A0A7X0C5Y7_9ACTN|nr:sigma-70 region 4 domain-containing protein [Nonomuraea muscovyensis]MBB6348773.1 DNA-directed RNA polymerase specialized sigma24 family protein [Nonomuraea muscovyensis]
MKRRDRDVVLLVALGGLSHAEVGEALGIPPAPSGPG